MDHFVATYECHPDQCVHADIVDAAPLCQVAIRIVCITRVKM